MTARSENSLSFPLSVACVIRARSYIECTLQVYAEAMQ